MSILYSVTLPSDKIKKNLSQNRRKTKNKEKSRIDKVYTIEIMALVFGSIIPIFLYFNLNKTSLLYVSISGIISLAIAILIWCTFILNGDVNEERLLFSNLIAIAVLLFFSVTSLLTTSTILSCNNNMSSNSITSNSITKTACNKVNYVGGILYSLWLIIFLVLLSASLILRLKHTFTFQSKGLKMPIFSFPKFISYWSLTFLIVMQLIIICNMTHLLPLVTSG